MPPRHGLHDGQAQAAAVAGSAGHSVEAVEHALALGRGDAGAAVLHRQLGRAARAARRRDLHHAAGGGVPEGVVDQVAQQHGQGVGLALDRYLGGALARAAQLDLVALARRAVHDAAPEAAAHAIELRGPEADADVIEVQGQADALAVLLRNLIDNALRHTPAGGVVQVSARRGESGAAELVVEDSGPGIPPSERQRVLDRFYRVPGAAGHGSGLGLAIVQAVARRHGARVEVGESAGLGGARVTVCWPAP